MLIKTHPKGKLLIIRNANIYLNNFFMLSNLSVVNEQENLV